MDGEAVVFRRRGLVRVDVNVALIGLCCVGFAIAASEVGAINRFLTVLLGVGCVVLALRHVGDGLRADRDGLTVGPIWRRRTYEWSEFERFEPSKRGAARGVRRQGRRPVAFAGDLRRHPRSPSSDGRAGLADVLEDLRRRHTY